MPKTNSRRGLRGSEHELRRRVAYERERRGWSTAGLAARLTQVAGCPIQQSAIWKIENGDPPRRVTVDELVAFARVFDVTVEELLRPVEAVISDDVAELYDRMTLLLEAQATLDAENRRLVEDFPKVLMRDGTGEAIGRWALAHADSPNVVYEPGVEVSVGFNTDHDWSALNGVRRVLLLLNEAKAAARKMKGDDDGEH